MRVGRILRYTLWFVVGLVPVLLSGQNSSFSFIYEGPTEIIVGEDCFTTLSWGHPNTPIAISNLPQGEIVSFEIYSISGGYTLEGPVPPGELVTILYQATDNFSNTAIFGFSITITDNIPPEFDAATLPPDIEVGCVNEIPPPADVMGFDNCMSDEFLFTITLTESGSADICEGGTITRTWVADDDLGNQSTYVQTITVLPDTTFPTITIPPIDGSGACDNAMELYANWIAEQRQNFTADDAGCGNISYSDNGPDPNIFVNYCGEIPVQFSASDDCGNTATVTATFFLTNSIPPEITTPASDAMASCFSGNPDGAFQAWLSNHGGAEAVDDCGSVIWTTNPPDPSLQDTCLTERVVEFIADDGCGNIATTTATFTVIDTTGPNITMEAQNRIITCSSSDVTVELATWISNTGNAAAADLCTNSENLVIEYRIGGVLLDSAGIFSALEDSIQTGCKDGVNIGGIIFNNMLALLQVEFIFKDQCGNGSGTSALFGIIEGLPPTITSSAQDMIVACQEGTSLENSFFDWYENAGNAQAQDDCGAIQWRGEPAFEEAFSQLTFALDTACGTDAVVTVNFYASDFCGLETDTFTTAIFGVIDTLPPVLISGGQALNVSCDSAGAEVLQAWIDSVAGAVAVDDCAALQWTYLYVNQGGDSIMGIAGQEPYPNLSDLNCSEANTFQFIASDFCGNEVSTTAQFTLIDTIPPMILLEGDTLNVSCEEIPTPDDVQVTDNCAGGSVQLIARDSILGDTSMIDCAGFIILREWVATDDCGNIALDTIFLFVSDEVPPTFLPPLDLTILCQDIDSIEVTGPQNVQDNCDLSPTVSFFDEVVSEGCNVEIIRTWIMTDDCGNQDSTIQRINFIDTIPPEIIACEDSLTIALEMDSCIGNVVFQTPSTQDDCTPGDSIQYMFRINDAPFQGYNPGDSIVTGLLAGTHIAEWEISDCTGNTSTCLTTILVEDLIQPEAICSGGFEVKITDTCTQLVNIPTPATIIDNCQIQDLEVSLIVTGATELEEQIISIEMDSVSVLLNIGVSVVSFIVKDPGGNSDTCTTTIELVDEIRPEAVCQDFEIVLDPAGVNDYTFSFEEIDDGSSDNCGLDSFSISPATVGCELIGETSSIQFIVIDESGNQDTCTSEVTIQPPVFEPSFVINICDVDTLSLFANPPGEGGQYTYNWTGPSSFESSNQNPVLTGIDSSNSGIYYVTITGQSGCFLTDSLAVTVSSLNLPGITSEDTSFCIGDTIILSATTYSEEVIYKWYLGSFPSGVLVDSSANAKFEIQADDSGLFTYYLIVSSTECEIGPSDSFSFEVYDVPQAMINDIPVSVCTGDSIQLQSFNDAEDVIYQWIGPDSFASNVQNPAAFEASIQSSGTYQLTVSQNGCISETESVQITVFETPKSPDILGNDVYCNGGTLELIPSIDSPVDSFLWIGPNDFQQFSDLDTFIIQEIDQSVSGSWQVISFSNGCSSDTSEIFEVNLEIETDVTAINSGPVCFGEDITIQISEPIVNAMYTWTGPEEFSSDSAQNIVSPAIPGIYVLSVLTQGGCELTLETEIEVILPPVIDTIRADFETCADGEGNGQLIPEISSLTIDALNFNWNGPNITSSDSILSISGISSVNTGTYFLSVSEGNCAETIDSISIILTDIPEKPQINGINIRCVGDSLILGSSNSYPEGAVFIWDTPLGEMIIPDDSLLIFENVDESAAGSYSLMVEFNDCLSISSDTFDLQIIASVETPQIISDSRVCEGDTIFLAVVGGPVEGGTYHWSGPSGYSSTTNEPFLFPTTDMAQGNYFVEVEIGPCRSLMSDAFFIEVVPRPGTPAIETVIDGICLDAPVPLEICIADTTLSEGATYYWMNAGSGTTLDISQAKCVNIDDFSSFTEGNNSILVETEMNGCRSFSSAVISFDASEFPEETAIIEEDYFICFGEVPIVSAQPTSSSMGQWSSSDDLLVFGDENSLSTEVMGLSESENLIIWSLSFEACENFSSDTSIISVESFPIAMDDSIVVDFGQTANFNVVFNDALPPGYSIRIVDTPIKGNTLNRGEGDFVYTPNIGFVGEDTFTYEVCSEECPDQCASATVLLIVGDETDCFVPTLFTPNSDGVNDQLIIPCLEAERFPNNRVLIFNQWGDEVFSSAPYQNDWDGTRKGKDLPVATYYFVVDFGDGSDIRKGFLVLER